ncbi:hypothetical protein K3172_02010 [Qipengyuania sp. 6B39]|uniref:hypothetical protein n=1 Tax=Qipengyuania proteolytica TaxID=2867239 RepID=UPI001C8A888E|nr:hypothetical protein [Qipengyuania proteolytica]MBX7494626.1 hypothetical protein [Qipengyuania proteolytica]
MSLSFLGRSAVFALLAIIAAWAGWVWAVPLARYVIAAQDSTQTGIDIASRAIAYRLDGERPMAFAFSQPLDRVKIISHAAVVDAPGPTLGARYTVRVRLFDADGAELASYDRSLLSGRQDDETATGSVRRFYRAGDASIWGQDQLIVENGAPFTRVEVELVDADAFVDGVDVRVYERRPIRSGEERSVFLRRSAEERAAFAAANSFPAEMLTPDEIRNLAINLWRPVGPVGIEGRDYRALVVYSASPQGLEEDS